MKLNHISLTRISHQSSLGQAVCWEARSRIFILQVPHSKQDGLKSAGPLGLKTSRLFFCNPISHCFSGLFFYFTQPYYSSIFKSIIDVFCEKFGITPISYKPDLNSADWKCGPACFQAQKRSGLENVQYLTNGWNLGPVVNITGNP